MAKLDLNPAASKANAFSIRLQCSSRTQTGVVFTVNSNFVCLEASEDRLGV